MTKIGHQDLEKVIKEALARYDAGRAKYGPLDLDTDERDFIEEMEAELLDCINYAAFQILRLRKLRERS